MKTPKRRISPFLICTVAGGRSALAEPRASAAIVISGVIEDASGLTPDGVVVKLTGSDTDRPASTASPSRRGRIR
jgi:hypothetical protein